VLAGSDWLPGWTLHVVFSERSASGGCDADHTSTFLASSCQRQRHSSSRLGAPRGPAVPRPETSVTSTAIRPARARACGGAFAPPRVAASLRATSRFAATMTVAERSNGDGAAPWQCRGKPRKLHGRAFYESIGSPRLVLAPMVEQSEFVRLSLSATALAALNCACTADDSARHRHGD